VAAERKAAVARQLAEERRAREAVLQRLRDAEQRVIAAQQEAILVVRRRRRRRDCCRDLLPPPPLSPTTRGEVWEIGVGAGAKCLIHAAVCHRRRRRRRGRGLMALAQVAQSERREAERAGRAARVEASARAEQLLELQAGACMRLLSVAGTPAMMIDSAGVDYCSLMI
jgi:hypothetical protein